MERIPILKMGRYLLITIQVDMHDKLAMSLQDDLMEQIRKTGAQGVLTTRMASDDARMKTFNDQITKLGTRMEAEQKRLKAQFAAMETALNNSQSQQAWLTSQIATLPSG